MNSELAMREFLAAMFISLTYLLFLKLPWIGLAARKGRIAPLRSRGTMHVVVEPFLPRRRAAPVQEIQVAANERPRKPPEYLHAASSAGVAGGSEAMRVISDGKWTLLFDGI
jgi:hypothetical protein